MELEFILAERPGQNTTRSCHKLTPIVSPPLLRLHEDERIQGGRECLVSEGTSPGKSNGLFPAYEIIGLIGSSRSDKDAGVYDALHRRISERISTALFSPFQAQLTFRASSSIRASQSIAGFGTIFPA
jgi:hypothetical protein